MFGEFSNVEQRSLMSDGFLRQRRNLILASLILPLFVFGEAQLEKLNIFGSTIGVGDPSQAYIAIFVIFIYFFFRYWQYYSNEDGANKYLIRRNMQIFRDEFEYFADLMRPAASVFDYEHYYPQYSGMPKSEYHYGHSLPELSGDEKVGVFVRKRLMQIYGVGNKYEQHYLGRQLGVENLTDDEVERISKIWRVVQKEQGDARSGPIFEIAVNYSTAYVMFVRARSYLSFLINKPDYTDYRFPIWLAVAAFVSSLVKYTI